MSDQRRASGWHVIRWAEKLYIRRILVENVPEFAEWGPLNRDGRPLPSKKGETFKAWIAVLESFGYRVEWNVLNAADYGDATTRKRLFVMARRDSRRLVWPVPTHARDGAGDLFGAREKWRPAREVIDWSLEGKSIFERSRPLSPNTLRRIEAGIRRFVRGPLAEAFLGELRQHADARSLDDPMPTVTGGGLHIALAEPELTPFVLPQFSGSAPRDVANPLGVVTTTSRGMALVEPFVAAYYGDGGGREPRTHDVSLPLPTATAATAEPFVLGQHGGAVVRSVADPLPTITADGAISIIEATAEPFVLGQQTNSAPRSVSDPPPTIATAGKISIIEPFLTAHFGERVGQEPRTHAIDEPFPSVTPRGAGDLVTPTIAAAETGVDSSRTVRGADGKLYMIDIRFRMLALHELAGAMGFPVDYAWTGTKEQRTMQVGNAVPVGLSCALVGALLADSARSVADIPQAEAA